MISIRGAITLGKNNSDEIIKATKELLLEIENKNDLSKENVISILFSSTKDLNAEYPAKAA
ncbi:chorismate mutase, partial [Schnuerera sp.]|uniref:chorismate mutase n=1 Tax=Schnuerera sp. TaxID=2794844 RepID=UPI002C6109B4